MKHPAQIAFEKNLKFLNQETYPTDFFRMLFTENSKLKIIRAGEADFPTGEVVLADPLAYLGSKYETVLDRRIPAGSYPVELSVCLSRIAGLRFAAARLLISSKQPVRYEIAMPRGKNIEDLGKPGVFTFLAWIQGLHALRTERFQKRTGSFLKNGRKKILGRTSIRTILPLFSRKAMKQIRNSKTRAEVFWNGNCRIPDTGRFCFPAVWETVCTAVIGDWMRRGRLPVWWRFL